jgi:hypothetical protein
MADPIIKTISEEVLEIITEKKETQKKTDLENRKLSLQKDVERINSEIAKVDELLAYFSK